MCYNRFRYYSPESGTYISQDPIGLASGEPNFYAYVSDSNSWVDVFGLNGELVYQLVGKDGVNYYGITSRDALTRMNEHIANGKVFDKMEILADNLTHDQARSIEGALIRKRMNERLSLRDRRNLSIKEQLEKAGLDNKNRGRVKERWLSDNPLDDLSDKMNKKPKKVKFH
ncbi:RHS repeat-associated core domain-containing protein [Cellulophaga geojensis]|uniref:RHS repeat-associated core domain-containing protein n=1 Tax=Cellulophaga lytica TaxID=979 RepID=UPI000A0164D6